MNPPANDCFVLLDDSGASADDRRSRLYTGYRATLESPDASHLPALLQQMERELKQGLHAVGLFDYEAGLAAHGLAARGAPVARILLFAACRAMSSAEVDDWLTTRAQAEAGANQHDDAARAVALAADPKNRSENLMIVDLLRNDLGKVAVPGSVAVPQLFHAQSALPDRAGYRIRTDRNHAGFTGMTVTWRATACNDKWRRVRWGALARLHSENSTRKMLCAGCLICSNGRLKACLTVFNVTTDLTLATLGKPNNFLDMNSENDARSGAAIRSM